MVWELFQIELALVMHPQPVMSNEVGVEVFNLEVVDGGGFPLGLDMGEFGTWPRSGDDRGSDAEFASGSEALVFDVEGMLLGALDLVAVRERENKRGLDLALEQALDRLRLGLACGLIARLAKHLLWLKRGSARPPPLPKEIELFPKGLSASRL